MAISRASPGQGGGATTEVASPRDGTARAYSSPLRERQARQTRGLILDALTDLLEEHAVDEITTRDVARLAGVSERTVYRHFPDREALLVGLGDRLREVTGVTAPGAELETLEDLEAAAVALMAGLDVHHVAARAEALFNADPRRFSAETRHNSQRFLEVLRRAYPQFSEPELLRLAAVMRCLLSAQAWLRMREEFGVPGTESGPVVAWAMQAMFNEIARGNPPPGAHTKPRRTRR